MNKSPYTVLDPAKGRSWVRTMCWKMRANLGEMPLTGSEFSTDVEPLSSPRFSMLVFRGMCRYGGGYWFTMGRTRCAAINPCPVQQPVSTPLQRYSSTMFCTPEYRVQNSSNDNGWISECWIYSECHRAGVEFPLSESPLKLR